KALTTLEPQPTQPLEGKEGWYYTLGVCPILDQFGIDEEAAVRAVATGTGLDVSAESLDDIVSRL
ncbi:MAG: hypothetical protein HXS40_06740, partial [Theionarchaea archaeon]|nr:hypothetical protein [Theionarchaea archaeon]